jgi:hypothetical protein
VKGAVKYLRVTLVAIAGIFAVLFALPMGLHTLFCERLPFGPCPASPYPLMVDFVAKHRGIWLVCAVGYTIAIAAAFRREAEVEFAKASLVRVLLQVLALALLLGAAAYVTLY